MIVGFASAVTLAFALNDAGLHRQVCGARACTLQAVGTVRTPAGAPQISVVRWPLCAANADGEVAPALRDLQTDGGCAVGYFRVVHRGAVVSEASLVAVDGNAGSLGYGAGGGEESVTLDEKTGELVHDVNGGSGWRWSYRRVWRLVPSVALMAYDGEASWRMNTEWSRSETWSAKDDVLSGAATYNACTYDPSSRRWTFDANADAPATSSGSYAEAPTIPDAAFDWRRAALPTWLEVRADAAPGKRRFSAVVTRKQAVVSPLSMRLAWLGNRQLLIELSGTSESAQARVELWWWEQADDGSSSCIVSKPEFTRRASAVGKKVDAGEASDGDDANPVLVASGVMQMLVAPDGTKTPAYGEPSADRIDVERAEIDGRVRLLVSWAGGKGNEPFALPYAVALSSMAGGRQRLVSHANLRFADPTSFALPMHRDTVRDDSETKAWAEALTARFAAKPDKPAN